MKKWLNFSFAANSLFLLVAVSFSYFWVNNPGVSLYTLQLVGLLVIVYFGNYLVNTKGGKVYNRKTLILDAVIFTMITYLLVSSTGYFASPLFFLLYFLAFGVALLFEPAVSLVLILIICVCLLGKINEGNFYDNLAKLISLILISPLAVFFGRQYLLVLAAKNKIKILRDWGKVLEKDLKKTSEEFGETEKDTLLFLALLLKNGLIEILDRASKLLSTNLNVVAKEEVERIRAQAKKLLVQADKLANEVDKRTDED